MSAKHGELLHIDRKTATRLRRSRPDPMAADQVAGRFRALADPTRLALALSLRDERELCVCDLSWIVQRSQNLVSHHMRALLGEGVVRSRRQGKMSMYSLTAAGDELVRAGAVQLAEVRAGR
jgi:DNA-binding transcriptional ArsR family regulator